MDAIKESDQRVLALAPTGKDARATRQVLSNAGIAATICADMPDLCRQLDSGAGAVLLSDESLKPEGSLAALAAALARQPKWSDLPLVLLASGGANSPIAVQVLQALQNVLVLDRPVHLPTLVSAVKTALRSRQRQYEIRDHLEERKRTEEALRASQERLALAASGTQIGMFDRDLATGEALWTEQLAKLLGLTTTKTTTTTTTTTLSPTYHYRDWVDRVHPADLPRVESEVRRCIAEHAPLDAEYRVVWPDGSVHWLTTRAVFQYDAQATPQRMLGIVMDITERKRAEEALEKAHAEAISEKNRLEAVMEALPVGVAITDARGGNIRSNSTFDQLWGGTFPPARSIGDYAPFQAWWVDTGQPVLPDEWASAQAVQRGVAVLGQLMEIQGFDGTRRFVVNSGAPVLDADGKIVGSVVAIQDITERIKLEKALQCAKEAAEAANVAKSRFLANMSHDLRTPMNAILGMIDVALPKAIDPTIKDCLQTAKGSADLLLTLLNDLLDSARIESGKFELESASFSLRRMLDQITRVLSVRASERGLSFFCRLPEAIPDAVVGDQIRLRQVLLNLVGNAIKFTERGEVAISVEQFPISDAESEICNLRFAVRDTGIGIPSSVQERLFKPFAQADASMTRRFGGTGLGLSISKSLVEMMGGTIWGESEQGKGSTFYFTVRLPLAKGLPSDSEARITVPTIARAQLRILLAEDNPANQKLATYILRTRGHVLEIAGDGQQAIDLSEQNRYDVILMDVEMPRMNGLEAAAVIRKRENSGSRVPIIAMTAHAMKGDRERCLAAGMDGYLSKPVNAQEMIGLVESLAAGAAAIVPPSLKEPTNPSAASAFDPVLALNRCLNKRDLLQEMIAFFFQDADTLLPQLRAALQNGDLTEVGRLGHRLKGTLSHIAADSASEAAERVEGFLLHAGEHAEAEEAVHALVRECEVLRAVLTEYLATTSPTQDGR